MRRSILLLSAGLVVLSVGTALARNSTSHNIILFIPDGLRALKVTPETAPAMAEVRDKGVNFKNPHSLFPTFTMANASGMATGHYLGDTGTFSNTIYTGYPSAPAGDTVVPFIENDAVLADVDEHFGGDYLNEETILKMARAKGFSTAAIGKVGPTLLFDHTDRADRPGLHSIVIDDSTGGKNGVPLSEEMKAALTKANLPLAAPSRGENGKSGDAKTPGTLVPNTAQQAYFADVASKIVLPMFKERAKAVRAGVLVARSGWHSAQHGRQPQHSDAGHQRSDFARQHQERRQQPGAIAQGARRSRPRRHHQHHDRRRPRLFDDFEGKQDQSCGKSQLRGYAQRFPPDGLSRHRSC